MRQVTRIDPIKRQKQQKIRVAAYCRVSTNSSDQQNSLAAQIRIYTRMIQKNLNWEMVEVFADEGISGTKAENRPEFQRMVRMCELRQIDLILVKSISRFARNVKEALEYVRKLKSLGIGVQFEKEGINTLTQADEMLLNVFSGIAQEESQSISQNMRLANQRRMESGDYLVTSLPYGYQWKDKKWAVYEPEAKIVRYIFQSYLNGMSATELGKQLTKNHVPTKCGSRKWENNRITYILKNEKYVGDCQYQKTYRDTMVPFKKYINHGEEDMYYAEDTHEPIIDHESFQRVQALLQKRQEKFVKTRIVKTYPFTSRIQCAECGSFYRRNVQKGTVKWACAKHSEDSSICDSHYYTEERICDGFVSMVNKLRFGEEKILSRVIDKLQAAEECFKRKNQAAMEFSQQIAELNAKLLMLEQLYSKNYLTVEIYQQQSQEIQHQLAELKMNRQQTCESHILEMTDDVKSFKKILDEVERPLETFDAELFRKIIISVKINNHDEMSMTVLGGLKFTEQI